MIDTVLGQRYRIVARIGEGATSEVFLAEHLHIGRREVIKVLRSEIAAEPSFVQRFRREARAINRLRHPSIISIYDFGQLPDQRLFLALEYAEGRPVDQILRDDGPFSVPRALLVLHQLAGAIDHAHTQGVVHRDLKPANLVLVEHRGQSDVLKVLDFGMAKIVAGEDAEELTRRGTTFGTPEYMAPEQITGSGPPDPRSDIYAVGCIAHALLVGTPPFAAPPGAPPSSTDRIRVLQSHLDNLPAPVSVRRAQTAAPPASISPVLDSIVAQCLAKDPAARFQTGQQLRMALEQDRGFPRRMYGVTGAMARARTGVMVAAVPFEPPETTDRSAPHIDVARLRNIDGKADTAGIDPIELRDELYQTLFDLCEVAVSNGMRDGGLVAALERVRVVRDRRLRLETDEAALEDRALAIEQLAREREGSLRFALGELGFDLGKAAVSQRADLRFQIEQLSRRLDEVLAEAVRDLDAIVEGRIATAATRANIDEHWPAAHAELQAAVRARIASSSPGDATPLAARLEAVTVALEQVQAVDAT